MKVGSQDTEAEGRLTLSTAQDQAFADMRIDFFAQGGVHQIADIDPDDHRFKVLDPILGFRNRRILAPVLLTHIQRRFLVRLLGSVKTAGGQFTDCVLPELEDGAMVRTTGFMKVRQQPRTERIAPDRIDDARQIGQCRTNDG